jgi:hypothetical protein
VTNNNQYYSSLCRDNNNISLFSLTSQMKQGQYSELGNSQYQLMTSVSMPVYDLRHNEVRLITFSVQVCKVPSVPVIQI